MKITIKNDYYLQSGKPYCCISFLSGHLVKEWSEEFNKHIEFEREYNFAFELPDSFVNNSINDSISRNILQHIEIGINKILYLYNEEFKNE